MAAYMVNYFLTSFILAGRALANAVKKADNFSTVHSKNQGFHAINAAIYVYL